MILQCDQCNTKFKLDDSKIKEGGIKVRCSKCKHVFVVTKEAREEVADFDALLNNLGKEAPAPQDVSPDLQEQTQPTQDEQSAGVQPEDALEKEMAAAAAVCEDDSNEADDGGFDFSDFNLSDDSEPKADVTPAVDEKEPAFGETSAGLSEFEFSAETETAVADPTESAAAADSLGMSEFSFNEEPAAAEPAKSSTPADSFGMSEFSFSEEPPAADPVPASDAEQGGGLGFGEFNFDDAPTPPPLPPAETAEAGEEGNLDFGSFAFEAPSEEAQSPAEAASSLDFEAAPADPFAQETPSFTGQEDVPTEVSPTSSHEPLEDASTSSEPGEFSFDFAEEAPAPPSVGPLDAAAELPLSVDAEGADLPQFSFSESAEEPLPTAVAQTPEVSGKAPENAVFEGIDFGPVSADAVTKKQEEETAVPPFEGIVPVAAQPVKEMSFAADPGPSFEDELPPLSIGSRRKGSSVFTMAGVAVAVVGVLGLAGAGIYFLKNDPAKLNKMGLGKVASVLGMKAAEDGRIMVRNPTGQFIVNKEAGELFVVSGDAVNEYRKPRASIQIKASLFRKNGVVVTQKVAYCGNRITKEQLETLPLDKLESAMNNQFGDSLSNLGIQPGKTIPFVVVFNKVPQDVSEFSVDVAGSTVATQ